MNDLKLFENNRFGKVRIVMRDNDPWFVAKDIAACIEYDSSSVNKMCNLCRERDKVVVRANDLTSDELSDVQNREYTLISESGLYRILAKCNLPKCEPFESWVFDEVLPSIRKTSRYGLISMPDFTNPAEAARAWALEYEKRQLAIAQRDEAIRTKCHFIEGRDAEMCGRVGGLTTENNRLKDAVGRGRNWQTVSNNRQEWIRRFGHEPSWRKLQEFSKEVGITPIKDVEETIRHHNGVLKKVKSYRYHVDAWKRYEKYETLLFSAEA